VLAALERYDEAVAAHQRATALNPQAANIWHNLGNALMSAQRHDDALAAFQKVLALRPGHIPALDSIVLVLDRLDRPADAIAYSRQAIAIEPGVADHHKDLANALACLGRDDEAEAEYDRALALDPACSGAMWCKALFLLSRGRYSEAWPLFEQRWIVDRLKMRRREYREPRWAGERVEGTLLVWAEQGLGDQILMSSMIPDLRRHAADIVLEVDRRLVPLLQRSYPDITVVAQEQDLFGGRPIAAHSALGDLARYLRPDERSFLKSAPGYLKVDQERRAGLRKRLKHDGRRVIGLSWASVNALFGRSKSARLADFAPLAELANCRFIDLQYGDTRAERDQVTRETGLTVEHLDDIDNTNDIDGLAALIGACDAVVTISNTTAHLAAAQGCKTRVVLSDGGGLLWYWMKRGDATPVYSSARLFRRTASQAWPDLVAAEVVPDLARHLDSLPSTDP
jgi:hypothetical protein